MNASTEIVVPTTALAGWSLAAFLASAFLSSPPDLFTLLLISAIGALPFAGLLIVSLRLLKRRRVPTTTLTAILLGLGIGISSALAGAMIVRFVFADHPRDQIPAAQHGAAGNGSMLVSCEFGCVSLAVARA